MRLTAMKAGIPFLFVALLFDRACGAVLMLAPVHRLTRILSIAIECMTHLIRIGVMLNLTDAGVKQRSENYVSHPPNHPGSAWCGLDTTCGPTVRRATTFGGSVCLRPTEFDYPIQFTERRARYVFYIRQFTC